LLVDVTTGEFAGDGLGGFRIAALIRPPERVRPPGSAIATSAKRLPTSSPMLRMAPSSSPSPRTPAGDTTTTDPRSKRTRVSRRGGQK